ncbi:MAG: acyltransferase domain-containing protein, partial [Chloroflexi bacterium]|nr:acyltransferase domain-containing protein [Chloroflexota bacterium]
AHGTATAAGDIAEIQALTKVFGVREADELPWCGLGTVKSMIGHTLPAAGIAGLIKTALALYHKVLPPTINCDEPNPKLELDKTPFYLNTETRPWIHADAHTPRRAGVNAFGFGGINAHVVLEEYPDTRAVPSISHDLNWETEVVILQGDSRDALIEQTEQLARALVASPEVSLKDVAYTQNTALADSTHRLAVVASSVDDLQKKLSKAVERLSDPDCHQIKDRGGIYFFEQPLGRQGKLAFLFPGEGSQYTNMLADLCEHFPEVRACFDQIDRIYADHPRKYLPSDFIFPRPMSSKEERELAEERLWQIDGAVEGVLTANHALFTLLSHLDIRPDAILGHSTGEYSAMRASGVFDFTDEAAFKQFSLDLNRMYEEEAAQDGVPRATLIALGASQAQAFEITNQVGGDVYVAMDNCPHQAVIVGEKRAAERVIDRVQQQGLIYQVLPFDRAYHTPLFEPYLHSLRDFFSRFPMSLPKINTWSCTTMSPYPNDVDEIRKLTVDHWMRPVEFRKTVEAMHADGVSIFVEVGARSNLTSFVDDTLRGQKYLAVPTNVERRSGITQINHMVGLLAAQGIHMKLDYLYERRSPEKLSFDPATVAENTKPRLPMKLDTGWPMMSISTELAARLRSRTGEQASPVVASEKNGAEASAKPTQAAEVQPTSEPVQPVEAPPPAQATRFAGSAAQPMDAYLETMERFLDTQQDVMQAFLGVTRTPQASEVTETRQPAQQLPTEAPSLEPSVEPVTVEVQPTIPQPEVEAEAMSATAIKDSLLELVSQRTGYPVEMLDLNMDMEADLGIDSIKRVEIMGAFRAAHGVLQDHHMESISELKTLQHIINLLESAGNEDATISGKERPGLESGFQTDTNGVSPSMARSFPLLGTAQILVPGRELIATKQVSWDEDLFLHDHTLGRDISARESGPRPLSVMPLTMSMEILAEAGSLLMPNKLMIGMKDIRAHKWIALESEVVSLEIKAHATEPDGEVRVEIREIGTEDSDKVLVEGTVVFGDAYPTPPATGSFSLRNERPSRLADWPTKRLYDELMFHGPRWQGVESVDSWGEDGNVSTFRVLETSEFFSSTSNPGFVTDPIVLDAAGQVVGFWTMEHLDSDRMVFPYHVEELLVYSPSLPEGIRVR